MTEKKIARKHQALVAVDKVEEAIEADEWGDARAAVAGLDDHLADLEDLDA